MKKMYFSCLGICILFMFFPELAFCQTNKAAAETKKLEDAVNLAKAKVAKIERSIVVADSLVSVGTQQVNESKTEIKGISTERKSLDKEYASKKKSLEKLSGSKDKTEATQAKADIKALDTKYKADTKAMDTRLKEATKKSSTGSTNVSKGKANKKTALDGLKSAQTALDDAQAKYDAVTGNTGESADDKKKKK